MTAKSIIVESLPNRSFPVKQKTPWQKLKRSWQLWALMTLPLAYILIFAYIPMLGVQIAFKDYFLTKGIWGSPWSGMKHFQRFINSYEFWKLIRNTLGISFYGLAAGFPIPIILALSLNIARHQTFKKTVQMITYAPHFISTVVMVGIILQFLDPRIGPVNNLIRALGLRPIHFMGIPGLFSSVYVWSGIWQSMGFSSIIYLAALSSVDLELYDAATIDGASRLQKVRYIELPCILPTAAILLILNTGSILKVGFEKIFLLQNPLNLEVSEVISTYVYRVGLSSSVVNFSYATAIGLFQSFIGMILLFAVNWLAKRLGQAGLF